jgi:hypothetical protein
LTLQLASIQHAALHSPRPAALVGGARIKRDRHEKRNRFSEMTGALSFTFFKAHRMRACT